jgi:DNA polymerase-1
MKICTLGLIYGMTAQGLANELNISVSHANAFQDQFLSMFPTLKHALCDTVQFGTLRGYALTHTGLRRYRAGRGRPSSWERNWLKNHPVQGSAAVLFKVAGNRLDKMYQRYHARLIIPLHDAFIFEAPIESLQEVAKMTERVMCEVVQEYFPELRPRAEINSSHPECWNKDGDVEAFTRWLENPLE